MTDSHRPQAALSRLEILKLVALTVLGTLVAWYLSAVLSFAGNTYGFNNRFTEVAIKTHWWYLLWSNVVVLKGYVLVAVGYVALIYPLVLLWSRVQSFGRWGVVWRSALFAGVLFGFFIMRLMLEKPYFGDYRYLEGWYYAVGAWFGKGAQGFVHGFIVNVFPSLTVVVAIAFYASEMRRWFGRAAKPLLFSVMSVVALMAAFMVSGYGVAATFRQSWSHRPRRNRRTFSSSLPIHCGRIICLAMAITGRRRRASTSWRSRGSTSQSA